MAFGNSNGDQQMLEYTQGGPGARFMLLVFHDDEKREYAYGPARGLRNVAVGAFTADARRARPQGRLDRRQHEGRLEADLPASGCGPSARIPRSARALAARGGLG